MLPCLSGLYCGMSMRGNVSPEDVFGEVDRPVAYFLIPEGVIRGVEAGDEGRGRRASQNARPKVTCRANQGVAVRPASVRALRQQSEGTSITCLN